MKRTFTARLPPPALAAIAHSVGAHLAAKLQQFESDERTLTDELCDMVCSWAEAVAPTPPSPMTIPLTLTKVTQPVEATIGADLELVVFSPFGEKRCLIQAKVIEPNTKRMRGDRPHHYDKLRRQLRDARQSAPGLAFLLLYVPGSDLDGRVHGLPTWEQQYSVPAPAKPGSQLGATFIPVDDLLNRRNSWWYKPPFTYAAGLCTPAGMPFLELLRRLLACELGVWQPKGTSHHMDEDRAGTASRSVPYRTLAINAAEASPDSWTDMVGALRLSDSSG